MNDDLSDVREDGRADDVVHSPRLDQMHDLSVWTVADLEKIRMIVGNAFRIGRNCNDRASLPNGNRSGVTSFCGLPKVTIRWMSIGDDDIGTSRHIGSMNGP